MRYKEIDINIKAIPDKEDEALLNQLMGAKGVSVSDADNKPEEPTADNSDNPGKVASDDPTTVPSVYPLQQELELKKQEVKKLEKQLQDMDGKFNIIGSAKETLQDFAEFFGKKSEKEDKLMTMMMSYEFYNLFISLLIFCVSLCCFTYLSVKK